MEVPPYLRKTITYNNSNWHAVYQNLRKERRRREMIVRVMAKTGGMVWAYGMMYKAVAIYGNEPFSFTTASG